MRKEFLKALIVTLIPICLSAESLTQPILPRPGSVKYIRTVSYPAYTTFFEDLSLVTAAVGAPDKTTAYSFPGTQTELEATIPFGATYAENGTTTAMCQTRFTFALRYIYPSDPNGQPTSQTPSRACFEADGVKPITPGASSACDFKRAKEYKCWTITSAWPLVLP